MKLLKGILTAVAFFAIISSYAQECSDEVSTDPRNPSNPNRPELENSFFWFPHDGNNNENFEFVTAGGIVYPSINSPFWTITTLPVMQLVNLENSDFYPEDGWELLKVNFGRLNDGTQRGILPSMPYLSLYNKYTGTIRFLGMLPNSSSSWQIIRFVVSLPKKKANWNNSGISLDATNLLSIQGDAAQPLDQKTEENVYEIITEYPGTSNASYFFWFDLPVAYDPCICNNDVAIQFTATLESTWDVQIRGILDAQIIQQGASNNGFSQLVTKRIIAAAGATATAIATTGSVVNVGPIIDLIDIFINRPGMDNDTKRGLEFLQAFMDVTATVVYDSEKVQWRNTGTGETMTKSDWDKLFTGLGAFHSAGVDFTNPTAQLSKPRTSVLGSITATGTSDLSDGTGDLIYWGVPGSNWTSYLDETISTSSGGLNPEYPIYNNPLGTFALLKTPTLQVKRTDHSILEGYELYPPWDDMTCHHRTYTQFQYFFDMEEIKYIYNPILNLDDERTEILASIVVKRKAGSPPFYTSTECLNNPLISGTADEPYCDLCIDDQIDINSTLELLRGTNVTSGVEAERYTAPVPLKYINEMVGGFLTLNYTSMNAFNYFIRFTLKIKSKDIGRDGKAIENTQIITFPLSPTEFIGNIPIPIIDIENDMDNYELIEMPTDLPTDSENFNNGYTEVVSHVYTSGGVLSTLKSASVIHLKPGAKISPNIRLAIDYPFQGIMPQPPFDGMLMNDFCNNNIQGYTYQANGWSDKAMDGPNIPEHLLEPYFEKSLAIKLFPNPASSDLTIQAQGTAIENIAIFDASGRPVSQAMVGGQHLYRMDVSSLAPGIYIVRATCGNDVLTEKLVIGK